MSRRLTIDMFPAGIDETILRRGDICDQGIIQDILRDREEIDETENILQNRDAYAAHYISSESQMIRLYHTFSRPNEKEPYRYAGLCAWGEDGNMHPSASKKVFIISQYHDEDPAKMEVNRRFAAAIAWNCVTRYGDIPVAPHLYFTQFMNDTGWEREFGIEAGHIMMRMCDSIILATIDDRISEGMKADLDYATIQLGLTPKCLSFSEAEATKYITETENDRYEEWNRAKHR